MWNCPTVGPNPSVATTAFVDSEPFSTTAVNVPDLPVEITFIGTDDTSDGYSFKFSVVNQSNDRLKELHVYLVSLDDSGHVEYAGNKQNPIDVAAHATRDWTFDLGCKLDDNSRVFVVLTEVAGTGSNWKVVKPDVTLDAFARGEEYMAPKVLKN
jgi:hypothetical protein